jgi:hypothetical protein
MTVSEKMENITLFEKPGSSRANNDAENKLREECIVHLASGKYTSFDDKWKSIGVKLHISLRTLCPDYSTVKMIQKGGRKFNYDFDAVFYNTIDDIIQISHIEFKHNASSLEKIPQFLSLQDKAGLIRASSYSEFYYTNFLDLHLSTISYTGEKPSLEEYVLIVSRIDWTSHPMFEKMRFAEEHNEIKKMVRTLVRQSISQYLELYANTFDISKFTEIVKTTQTDKQFLLWDLNDFRIQQIDTTSNVIFKGVKNNNTIVLISDSYEYHLLLRWRNHLGILNPAWQISCHSQKSEKLFPVLF